MFSVSVPGGCRAQGRELPHCADCPVHSLDRVSFPFSQCQKEEVVLDPAVYSGPTERQGTGIGTGALTNPRVTTPAV